MIRNSHQQQQQKQWKKINHFLQFQLMMMCVAIRINWIFFWKKNSSSSSWWWWWSLSFFKWYLYPQYRWYRYDLRIDIRFVNVVCVCVCYHLLFFVIFQQSNESIQKISGHLKKKKVIKHFFFSKKKPNFQSQNIKIKIPNQMKMKNY